MLKLLFRTDVHVADKSPASWKGDYCEEIFESLSQIATLAKGCTAVLDGGDFFHVKTPGKNSHGLLRRVIETHKSYPCPVYSIEGNHDLRSNDLDSLESQPLGVLFEAGIFNLLRDEVFEANGIKVRVVGFPYDPERELTHFHDLTKGDEDYLVAVVHALAAENPSSSLDDFFNEQVFRYSDIATPHGPDLFCFGHWHTDQGVVRQGSKWFVNQGSVSRGSLNNDNLSRTPKVCTLTFTSDGISVEEHPLIVSPVEEVYDLERKGRQDYRETAIVDFVQRLQREVQADPSKLDDLSLDSLDFAPEVRALAKDYLLKAARK